MGGGSGDEVSEWLVESQLQDYVQAFADDGCFTMLSDLVAMDDAEVDEMFADAPAVDKRKFKRKLRVLIKQREAESTSDGGGGGSDDGGGDDDDGDTKEEEEEVQLLAPASPKQGKASQSRSKKQSRVAPQAAVLTTPRAVTTIPSGLNGVKTVPAAAAVKQTPALVDAQGKSISNKQRMQASLADGDAGAEAAVTQHAAATASFGVVAMLEAKYGRQLNVRSPQFVHDAQALATIAVDEQVLREFTHPHTKRVHFSGCEPCCKGNAPADIVIGLDTFAVTNYRAIVSSEFDNSMLQRIVAEEAQKGLLSCCNDPVVASTARTSKYSTVFVKDVVGLVSADANTSQITVTSCWDDCRNCCECKCNCGCSCGCCRFIPFWVEDLRGKSDRFRIGTVGDLPGFIVTVDEKDANAARLVILHAVAAAFAASRGPPPQAMKL